nr:hypothetical protein [Tolivirales sp.]
MAKQRSKNAQTQKRRRSRARVVGNVGPRIPTLDNAAAQYALLLKNPTSAPLVHPIYAGGEGGYLFRAQTTFTLHGTDGATAGYLHWTPGAIGSDGIDLLAA